METDVKGYGTTNRLALPRSLRNSCREAVELSGSVTTVRSSTKWRVRLNFIGEWRCAFRGSVRHSNTLENARRLELQGSTVRVPSPEDLILMLCIHGAKDFWERLEWVCGLAELIRSEADVDWKRLLEHAKKIRCMRIISLGLVVAQEMLGAPVPAGVLSQLCSRKQLGPVVDQVVTRFFRDDAGLLSLTRRIRFHVGAKDSPLEMFRYCARLALTTTPVDWEMMHLPEFASFLYLPLRAFRLLRKYGGEDRELTSKTSKSTSIGPA